MDGAPLRLSVQALCSLMPGQAEGNAGGGWIPGRSRQGQRAHQRLQERLRDQTDAEVPLEWEGVIHGRPVLLGGRADLIDRDGRVEEIKTVLMSSSSFKRVGAKAFPGHVMQALLYAWMHQPRDIIKARLRLVNLTDGEERVLDVERPAAEILQFLETQLALYQARQDAQDREKQSRLERSRRITFPFDTYRPGQRALLQDVENALQRGRTLLLNAPTGLGKSVSVLLPALQAAMGSGRKVFFCTAKNTGRHAALEVVKAINAKQSCITAVALSSREGMCTAETYFCHEEHCPFLQGFADRLDAALLELLEVEIVDRDLLMDTGVKHRVCPHELALCLSESRDLVVGDYNYVFDPQVRIRRHFVEGDPEQFLLVVDEAHNLAPRARSWFSSELGLVEVEELLERCLVDLSGGDLFHEGPIQRSVKGMQQALEKLRALILQAPEREDGEFHFAGENLQALSARFDVEELQWIRHRYEGRLVEYMLACVMLGLTEGRDPYVMYYRKLDRFVELCLRDDEAIRQVVRVSRDHEGRVEPAMEIHCSWAGDWLSEQLARFPAAVLFSATLKPWEWITGELGLDGCESLERHSVPSPFPPENRNLVIFEGFSSRWRDRSRGMNFLARLVRESFDRVGGNMAVFLPSFSYLRSLRDVLGPGLPLLVHDGSMEPRLREALLKRLRRGGPHLLLSVMGGVFAEAVDYPGSMLECAIMVGPGLPQLSHERELARLYYEGRGESGHEKAYRLPGLIRVLQSAGRVLRRPEDRGSIILLGERFSEWDNLQLIEEFYEARPAQEESLAELLECLARFHGGET